MISLELHDVLQNILLKIEKGEADPEDAMAIYNNMANRLKHVQRKSVARKRACREANRVIRERTSWWEDAYARGPSWKYRELTQELVDAADRLQRQVGECTCPEYGDYGCPRCAVNLALQHHPTKSR